MSETSIAVQQPTVMEILSQAVLNGNVSVDVIERLTKLQREQVEYNAMVEFNEALQRCQDGLQPIRATIDNSQTGSKYASYVQLDKVIRPIYSKEGFSLSFSTEESQAAETVIVVCTLARGGFSRRYAIPMATDGKGPKGGSVMTRTHAVGAAATYGMRYLLKMIFNLAIGEDDDDGNLSELTDEQRELITGISKAESQKQLMDAYKRGAGAALASKNMTLVKMVLAAKDARVKELANAQADRM